MSSLMEMCAYTIAEKDQQIAELEKALELIYNYEKERANPSQWIYNATKEEYINHFKEQAKKELNNDR